MLNAANIYLFLIILTKCKYILKNEMLIYVYISGEGRGYPTWIGKEWISTRGGEGISTCNREEISSRGGEGGDIH